MSSKLENLPFGTDCDFTYGIQDGGTSKKYSSPGIVNVKDFGAVGDNITDDTLAIQAAVDHALSHRRYTVYMPAGEYKTSNTIHLGYGWIAGAGQVNSIELVGEESYYLQAGIDYSPFVQLRPTFVDRPVINIQGARNVRVRHIGILGICVIPDAATQTLAWRADSANYVTFGAKDDEDAPFCGICIDGYAAGEGGDPVTPANPYPTPPYPAWVLPAPATPYNLTIGHSSQVIIDNCMIQRTLIGVMVMPYGDGNADYVRISNCDIFSQKVGIAWGNSQARSTDLQNTYLSNIHTCFSGNQYGRKIGNFAGNWDNINCDRTYRLLSGAPGWFQPFMISNYYSELAMIIGDGGNGITFYNCSFGGQDISTNGAGTITEYYSVPFYRGDATFIGCVFGNQVAYKFVGNCRFQHCQFRPPDAADGITAWSSAKQIALAAFHGVFLSPGQAVENSAPTADCPFEDCQVWGNAQGHTAIQTAYYTGHDHYYMMGVYSKGSQHNVLYDIPNLRRVGIRTFGATSLSSDTLVMDAGTQDVRPGDVVHNTNHGFWYVESQSTAVGFPITCRALTDVAFGSSVWTMVGANSSASSSSPFAGNWYYYPVTTLDLSPSDVPAAGLFLTTSSGSATVNLVNGVGAASTRPTLLTTNSKPLWHGITDASYSCVGGGHSESLLPFPSLTYVTSVSSTSITMSANALVTGTWLYSPGIKRIR